MEERKLNDWSEFKENIEDIRDKFGYHELPIKNDQTLKEKNIVLFRGQQSASWPIKTTLERYTKGTFPVARYLLRATRIAHEIESFTGAKWNIPDGNVLIKEIREKQDRLFGPHIPCYDYLVYLRHHGFPSPLLDWSESPYIAAYFAVCDSFIDKQIENERFAIYTYIDRLGPTKAYTGGPKIEVKGPFISTHKRHFIQKAWYTFASKWLTDTEEFEFCSHHEVFDNPHKLPQQDILIKITLPISEREKTLRDLDEHNINHFTLFQTEDSLVKALSIREFDINN